MEKVFHFEASREQYHCDAAIVWCFDNRFELGFRGSFSPDLACGPDPDPIKIAGGAQSLASPRIESDREFVLDQIRASITLHGTKRVIMMLHSDCGAYGGLANFSGDTHAEIEHHKKELRVAARVVRAAIPNAGRRLLRRFRRRVGNRFVR